MEMIDVIRKLEEIANKSPEVAKAIQSTEAMNPKQQAAIAIAKKEKMKEAPDSIVAAQQAVEEYLDGDTLTKPKIEVINDLKRRAKAATFPQSYELETAAQMVADKYDDDGDEKFTGEQVNTNTMETKDKKPVKEAIQMTADTPQEASMLMQILQMAGIKPMGADMPSKMTIPSDEPEHGSEMDPGDDAMGSMQMAKMRDMMMKPDMEKQEESFANSEKEAEKAKPVTQDIDTLVNYHSGGLGAQRKQYRKEFPGDNPMAVKEDTITEEDLANSLRTQYDNFKQAYQEAAKPDYIDLDKDGNKTEPMKKAAQDKKEKEKQSK
tara:strand:- start:1997 stop:2962 length:966 start_codon:yes stop_codon:yes gene_type:complete